MPNWTYNRVYGSKKVCEALLVDHKPSFINVVPIPAEIEKLEHTYKLPSPHTDFDMYKDFYFNDGDELYKEYCSHEKYKETYSTFADFTASFASKYPVDMMKLSDEAIQKYGCDDWYSWNNKYWGCKWDANPIDDEYEDGVEEIRFETPWSPPEGVIKRIAEMFPDENWTWHSDEESCAFSVDFHPDGSGGYYEEDVDPEYYLPYIPETLEEFMDDFSGLTTRDDILEQVDIKIDEKTHTIVVTVYNHEAYGGEKLFDAVFSNVKF